MRYLVFVKLIHCKLNCSFRSTDPHTVLEASRVFDPNTLSRKMEMHDLSGNDVYGNQIKLFNI